jgi:hypothetical protein
MLLYHSPSTQVLGMQTDYEEFEVLTVVVMESYISWDITPSSALKFNQSFGEICRFHLLMFQKMEFFSIV